jgi:hypothetical protein
MLVFLHVPMRNAKKVSAGYGSFLFWSLGRNILLMPQYTIGKPKINVWL